MRQRNMPSILFATAHLLRLTRPYLWPAIIANACAAAWLAGLTPREAISISLALISLSSGGFLLNDVVDTAIDEANAENRLNRSSPRVRAFAAILSVAGLALGVTIGFIVSSALGFLMSGVCALLVVYSGGARRSLVLATIVCALAASSPYWIVLAIRGAGSHGIIDYVIAVSIFVAGREVMLDQKDVNGDRVGGRHTIPVILGRRVASSVSQSLMTMSALLLCLHSIQAAYQMTPIGGALFATVGFLVSARVAYVAVLRPMKATLLDTSTVIGSTRQVMLFFPGLVIFQAMLQ